MNADAAAPAPSSGRERIAVVALVALVTLPFLWKPFHIDDTFFLRVTESIVADPADPYGGTLDWWDRPQPLFQIDSNPPLLNYWLAPFAAFSDYSEPVLHAAMLPFHLLLAFAVFWLGRRFSAHPWWVLAFVMTSVAVVVSGNVMRDVPAAALGVAAIAAVVAGSDADDRRWLAAGFLAAGLAVLTKYSAWLVVAVAAAYPLLKGRLGHIAWAGVPLGVFALWYGHNLAVYGESHFFAQLGRGYTSPGHGWRDNLSGLPVVVGSLVYLLPALLAQAAFRRDGVGIAGAGLAAGATGWAIAAYTGGAADVQYQFWGVTGGALLALVALGGLRGVAALGRDRRDGVGEDSLFLLGWLAAPVLLSVVFVPFQAVRHLLPALVPLVLLAVRFLERGGEIRPAAIRAVLGVCLATQAGVALAVAGADEAYADSYRDFAAGARRAVGALVSEEGEAPRIWYLGHWGWMFYAERAGLEKLHSSGPYPARGDFLIVPAYVDKGKVLERTPRLVERLQQVEQIAVAGTLPIRTMHPSGAGFYAMFSRPRLGRPPPVPYRFGGDVPLEIFDIHRLGAATGGAGQNSRSVGRDADQVR